MGTTLLIIALALQPLVLLALAVAIHGRQTHEKGIAARYVDTSIEDMRASVAKHHSAPAKIVVLIGRVALGLFALFTAYCVGIMVVAIPAFGAYLAGDAIGGTLGIVVAALIYVIGLPLAAWWADELAND